MKLKLITLFAAFCLFTTFAKAQKPAMSIYGELGGPGLASINFDTRFEAKNGGIGGRIGIGGFSIDGTGALFVPIQVNYLIGKDDKNFFEVGGGVTYVNENDNSIDGNFSSTFGHLWMGYRLQPKTEGVIFRAGICPIFGNGFFVPYYFGLSVGYKF